MGHRSFSPTRLALVLVAAAILPLPVGMSAAWAATPSNDSFANATVLTGSDGSVAGSNVDATKEAGEPSHADNSGGRSVWYRWTAPVSGQVTLTTAGSSFDTLLGVYTGSAVGSLSLLTSTDDPEGGAGLHSSVAFSAAAGTVYRIAVDGYAAETGTINLSWAGVALPASITVTGPNGGESVNLGTNLPITFTYGPAASPAAAPSAAPSSLDASGESDLDAAAATAARDGAVQSIVRLSSDFAPEGGLGQAQARGQRQGIADKRQGLLGRLKGSDHTVVRAYDSLPLVALRLSPGAVARLRGAPEVASVTEDRLRAPTLEQSRDLVEGTASHAAGFDGTGQMVAVLDSGVDKTHPYLAGKVVAEACYASTGSCPNGQTSQTGPGSGVACTFSSQCDHGTHVAGIVAGASASSSGIGRGASLMAVQVFGRYTGEACSGDVDPCARARDSDMIAGLERVFALRNSHSIAAVNMSIGGGEYPGACDGEPEKLAIDNLRSAGIATVISSGNDGFTSAIGAPACISSAVSVGASTETDSVASFSNSAATLSLLAPGAGITSSVPGGAFEAWDGTSMAAPHVAGAWAVMKQLKPTASVTQVLTALQSSGRPVLDGRNGITRSRIRLQRAMLALDPKVRIELLRGGAVVTNIVDNLPVPAGGLGTYSWPVPAGLPAASDYAVRVTSVPDPRASDLSNARFTIGASAAVEPLGDYDGSGSTDVAVYRPSSGVWYVQSPFNAVKWGEPGDIPVPGDYDDNGTTEQAVYRPATGVWYVQSPFHAVRWGEPGDIPVPGDYDDNGTTEQAVYRPSTGVWYLLGPNPRSTRWGETGDIPVPGDYDANGSTDVAAYRPSTGVWYVQSPFHAVKWGEPGDVPVPGDYDGDGITEHAVYRPSTGVWYLLGPNPRATKWGETGDLPLTLPPGVYRRFFLT